MRARLTTIPFVLALFALMAPLGTSSVSGAATPKFLTLPFEKPAQIHIQRGWWTPQQPGGPFTVLHHGIDYIHGTLDVPSSWANFPVVAAAGGEACAEVLGGSGCYDAPGEIMGNRVLIKHTVDGVVYYTFYNHLKSISDLIPRGSSKKTVHVKQGEVIGVAGASGNDASFIHLHFELQNAKGRWIDPYGLYAGSRQYPDAKGRNGILSGPRNYFLTNPPTVLSAAPGPTPSAATSPTPRPSRRPAPTSTTESPGKSAAPSAGTNPSSTNAAAATSVPSGAAVLPPESGTSPQGGGPSAGSLGPTTIAAGIVAVACLTFLAVVLLRRRTGGLGSRS